MKSVPMQPNRGYFVTGTDTEVGKTFIACRLIEQLRSQGLRVGAYKPVASGAGTSEESDSHKLWLALGQGVPMEWITPQSFRAPLAPPIAAEMEGRCVEEELLLSGLDIWKENCECLIVEGAGGLLSPISWSTTNADLAKQVGYPLILVAANRLGAVHQILATTEVAIQRGLRIAEIVLNEPNTNGSELAAKTNMRLLIPFLHRLCPEIIVRNVVYSPGINASGLTKWK